MIFCTYRNQRRRRRRISYFMHKFRTLNCWCWYGNHSFAFVYIFLDIPFYIGFTVHTIYTAHMTYKGSYTKYASKYDLQHFIRKVYSRLEFNWSGWCGCRAVSHDDDERGWLVMRRGSWPQVFCVPQAAQRNRINLKLSSIEVLCFKYKCTLSLRALTQQKSLYIYIYTYFLHFKVRSHFQHIPINHQHLM